MTGRDRRMVGHYVIVTAVTVFLLLQLVTLNERGLVTPPTPSVPGEIMVSRRTYDPKLAFGLREDDRDLWQKPEQVLDSVGGLSGLRVADVGCGEGYFTLRLLDRVGPMGQVFAVDIQPAMLQLLQQRVPETLLPRLELVQATVDDTGIEEPMDVIFLIQVLAEVDHQATFLSRLKGIMHEDSRLVIIDSKHVTQIHSGYSYPLNTQRVIADVEALGFELIPDGQFSFLPRQFFLIFQLRQADLAP